MKIKPALFTIMILGTAFILSGCLPPPSPSALPDPDTATVTLDLQATVDYSVIGTQQTDQALQATVDHAVQATIASLPPTPTSAPTAVVVEISEEELANLIDESVNEAIAASDAAYQATTETISDSTVSEDEVLYVTSYTDWANEAIYYAEYLIEEYYAYYGEYAEEALSELSEIESDLETIATSVEEIDAIMAQGTEVASAAIEQLNTMAQQANANLSEVQTIVENLQQTVQANIEDRTSTALNLGSSEIAGDLDGTVNLLHDYIDSVKLGMEDGRISPDELNVIAQLGANAQASLLQFNSPRLQEYPDKISGLTSQLARGEWPQVSERIPDFEVNLPERPAGGLGSGPRP